MGKSGQSLGCLRLIGTNQPIFMHSPLFTCVTQCVAAQQFQSNQTKPNQTSQPIFMHSPLFYVWTGTAVSKLSLWPQCLHRSNPWLTKVHFSMSSKRVRVRFTENSKLLCSFFLLFLHPLNYPLFCKPVKCSQNGMHQKRILSERRHPPVPI